MKSRPLSDLPLMAVPPWTEDPRITRGRLADEALERHYEEHPDELSDSHHRGAAAPTTVEARGTTHPRPGLRESNRESGDVGRAAGAQLTGQRQDGLSQGPVSEQYPPPAHAGWGAMNPDHPEGVRKDTIDRLAAEIAEIAAAEAAWEREAEKVRQDLDRLARELRELAS